MHGCINTPKIINDKKYTLPFAGYALGSKTDAFIPSANATAPKAPAFIPAANATTGKTRAFMPVTNPANSKLLFLISKPYSKP